MADELIIKVVSGTSENLQVHVDLASASVLALKHTIEKQNIQRFPVSAQRLIFQGQILEDNKLLTDYHVAAGCALHLTLSPSVAAAVEANAASESSPSAQLQTFLQLMRSTEPQDLYAIAVRTLQKICANIVNNPNEEKYRSLRVDNVTLKSKLFDRTRGLESVKLLGFQDSVQAGHLVLVPTPEKWENLVACKAVVDSAAATLGGATATRPFGASPSIGGMGGMNGGFASQAQSLLQNPAMLQSLMSNPMVQQLAQQNPMLTQVLQNPALLSQSLQTMQQNPAMMQQMNQMMSDPNGIARMQQMMTGGGMGSFGSFGGLSGAGSTSSGVNPFASNPFASSSSTPVATASNATSSGVSTVSPSAAAMSDENDDEAYKEDDIALAIARSLQDQ